MMAKANPRGAKRVVADSPITESTVAEPVAVLTKEGRKALEERLVKEPGVFIALPISGMEIGGELVSILSKGLYTNPLDALREYIQNSVDAGAGEVSIKLTGNSLTILDNGNGMDIWSLVQARQFAVSPKSMSEHVGFRGIGIYSGFDLCERLRITSQRKGDTDVHILAFDFGKMKELLDFERLQPPGSHRTSLIELLSKHTFVRREPAMVSDRSFTQVELQGVTDSHVKTLGNRDGLRNYLLQNLPIDFHPDFPFREKLNKELAAHVPGYNAVAITLHADGLEDEVIVRPSMPDLQEPKFQKLTYGTRAVAFVWSCLTAENHRIDDSETAGFVYKSKGFTIGDRERLHTMFGDRPQVYPWYTGEVYVLDSAVIPNAARNDFETNPAKDALEVAVREYFEKLEDDAVSFQQAGVADRRVEEYASFLDPVEERLEANTSAQALDDFADVMKIKNSFKRQSKLVSPGYRKRAASLAKRMETVLEALRETIGSNVPEEERRKAAAKNPKVKKRGAVPAPTGGNRLTPRTLSDVLSDLELRFSGVVARVMAALDNALADSLTVGSEHYDRVIASIEARLTDDLIDESSTTKRSSAR